MIVASPDRNIAIAPPDLRECNPTLSFVKPNLVTPISSTMHHILDLA